MRALGCKSSARSAATIPALADLAGIHSPIPGMGSIPFDLPAPSAPARPRRASCKLYSQSSVGKRLNMCQRLSSSPNLPRFFSSPAKLLHAQSPPLIEHRLGPAFGRSLVCAAHGRRYLRPLTTVPQGCKPEISAVATDTSRYTPG
jgi:hypothetical protein